MRQLFYFEDNKKFKNLGRNWFFDSKNGKIAADFQRVLMNYL